MDGTSTSNPNRRNRLSSTRTHTQEQSPPKNGRSRRAAAAVPNAAAAAGTAGHDRSPARRSLEALMESRLAESRQIWQAFLGPLLSKTDVLRLLGAESAQEVDALVATRRLLALPTPEGDVVYPALQFRSDGQPYPALARVIEILEPVAITPYTIASWLKRPTAELGGRTPIEWLEQGRDPRRVVAEARLAADQLAHS